VGIVKEYIGGGTQGNVESGDTRGGGFDDGDDIEVNIDDFAEV